jgi:HSP20 family protein
MPHRRTVEVTDGHFALSGERKREKEEKKGDYYRSEHEYGSFYRAVPLPERRQARRRQGDLRRRRPRGQLLLPARPEANIRRVQIEELKTAAKSAA